MIREMPFGESLKSYKIVEYLIVETYPKDKRTTKTNRQRNKSKEKNDDLILIRRIACRTR